MITENQAGDAVSELGAIPYFPREAGAHTAIIRALCAFVASPDRLRWLVDTAVNRMAEWKGVAELRALYCTRWRPIDGIAGTVCTIPGYTPGDCEAEFQQRHVTGAQQKFLPAPDDSEITPEERAQIDALDRKVKLGAAEERARKATGLTVKLPAPKYLENL